MEPHDLVLAKLVRGLERDWDYARVAVRAGIVQMDILHARARSLPVNAEQREAIVAGLGASVT